MGKQRQPEDLRGRGVQGLGADMMDGSCSLENKGARDVACQRGDRRSLGSEQMISFKGG